MRGLMDELAGVRVLVVDDERDTLDIVALLIRSHGAETRAAGSAAEALACLGTFRPHALVSDLAMPEEDGHALIRRVRALPAEEGGAVPAVALSAHVYGEDRDQALAAGFNAFLPKPVRPRLLVDCLRALLGRPRAFGERRRGERRKRAQPATAGDRRRWQRRHLQTC
ncbi:MAG TPA: response regulator [Vicinamibacteria bacterium]|nr:response regulator [Vicinamibacteria bacterium]